MNRAHSPRAALRTDTQGIRCRRVCQRLANIRAMQQRQQAAPPPGYWFDDDEHNKLLRACSAAKLLAQMDSDTSHRLALETGELAAVADYIHEDLSAVLAAAQYTRDMGDSEVAP